MQYSDHNKIIIIRAETEQVKYWPWITSVYWQQEVLSRINQTRTQISNI